MRIRAWCCCYGASARSAWRGCTAGHSCPSAATSHAEQCVPSEFKHITDKGKMNWFWCFVFFPSSLRKKRIWCNSISEFCYAIYRIVRIYMKTKFLFVFQKLCKKYFSELNWTLLVFKKSKMAFKQSFGQVKDNFSNPNGKLFTLFSYYLTCFGKELLPVLSKHWIKGFNYPSIAKPLNAVKI